MVDDPVVRGTRSLDDIYQRCNIDVLETVRYLEAEKYPKWKALMKEELSMIETNENRKLVERPKHQKVIRVKWVFKKKGEYIWNDQQV